VNSVFVAFIHGLNYGAADFVEAVSVDQTFEDVSWHGEVRVFDLPDYAHADRCFAWAGSDEKIWVALRSPSRPTADEAILEWLASE